MVNITYFDSVQSFFKKIDLFLILGGIFHNGKFTFFDSVYVHCTVSNRSIPIEIYFNPNKILTIEVWFCVLLGP